jgi:hypothetical protein
MKVFNIRSLRWKLFLLGFVKIPMIHFVRPKLMSVDQESLTIKIPFRRRTRNHLNSMYFGALAVGADLAAGYHVYCLAEHQNTSISLAFKSTQSQFLKRPESDVFFYSNSGKEIRDQILKALESQERINFFVEVKAQNTQNEDVALFAMEVSIRAKAKK